MYSWFIAFAICMGFAGVLAIIIGFIVSLYYKIKEDEPMGMPGWYIIWAIILLFGIGLGWLTQKNVNVIRYPETEYNIVALAEALNISPDRITYKEGIDCAYIENHQLLGTDDYKIVYPKNTNTVNAEDFRYDKADT